MTDADNWSKAAPHAADVRRIVPKALPDTPTVSIVTPSYNQCDYLEETIRSILEQDYPRIEYIVIDGGSTDSSIEVIRRFAPHLAHWVSEPDRGQAHAINKGFTRCTGDVLGWVNSDDVLTPHSVRKAVQALQRRSDVGAVYSDFVVLEERSGGRTFRRSRQVSFRTLVANGNRIPQPTTFVRRDVLMEAGPLDETLHLCLDLDLWLRVSRAAPMLYLAGEALALLREHAEAKGTRLPIEWAREHLVILNRLYARPELATELSSVRRSAYAYAYWRVALACLHNGALNPEGLRALARSATLHPKWVILNPRTVLRMLGAVLRR